MKLLLLLLAFAIPAHAATTVTATPGPWDLFKGSSKLASFPTTTACVEGARARAALLLPGTYTYTCRSSTKVVATVVVDTPPPVAPVAIVLQPVGVTVLEGAPLSLSVGATGGAPLAYQWFKDGVPVSLGGGLIPASATYTLTSVTVEDAGTYTVVVRNSVGSVTSAAAVVSVTPKPPPIIPVTITEQPVSATVAAGAAVSFAVKATGELPLSYRWSKDGVDLLPDLGAFQTYLGITGPVLDIREATSSLAGRYRVAVTNPAGTLLSNEATLTVTEVVTGSATLTWSAPEWKANGIDPADVAGYLVRYGRSSEAYINSVRTVLPQAVVFGLAPGTWFFAVFTLDSAGYESGRSFEISKTIP